MAEDPEKDEGCVKFGCGGLLGAFLGSGFSLGLWRDGNYLGAIGAFACFVFLAGTLSRKCGDAFWQKIADWGNLNGRP